MTLKAYIGEILNEGDRQVKNSSGDDSWNLHVLKQDTEFDFCIRLFVFNRVLIAIFIKNLLT